MPEESNAQPSSTAAPRSSGMKVLILVLVLGLAAVTGYSLRQHRNAADLAAQNQAVATVLQQTQQQVQALNAKIDAMSAPPAPAPAPVARPAAVAKAHPAAHRVVRRRDDPRWKKVQEQLDAQNKRIDDTQSALQGTKTELSGSIARTHDELVVLQRKGERNYYEFDIDKSKQFHTQGPVGIRLKKANVKHQYADMELYVDDAKLTQKHVNLLQPVVFYASDSGMPVEIVVNKITKNHIHGYLSEPKYKKSELTAMENAAQSGNGTEANTAPRQKLTVPR